MCAPEHRSQCSTRPSLVPPAGSVMGALPFRVGLHVGALIASVTAVRVACQVTAESFCSAWHRGRGWPSPGEMAGVLHTFPWDLPSGPFASTPDCPPATPPGLHLCAGEVRTEAALCFPNWGASKPSGTGWGGPGPQAAIQMPRPACAAGCSPSRVLECRREPLCCGAVYVLSIPSQSG